eukprot:4041978-Prorocentrum_lima.AAC.1
MTSSLVGSEMCIRDRISSSPPGSQPRAVSMSLQPPMRRTDGAPTAGPKCQPGVPPIVHRRRMIRRGLL